jgi:hypothetical protein
MLAIRERLRRKNRSQFLKVRDIEAALQQNKGVNVADIGMVIVLCRDELHVAFKPAVCVTRPLW